MLSLRIVLAAAGLFSAALMPYAHPQRLVDVGGRRMNLYCTGSGSPTVVLASTGDDSTVAWRFVQPAVAKRTRVCSYDGAGLGFSDAAPGPRDADAMAGELHTLLARAGVAGPIVLVGDSLSGLWGRVYADRYARDLAGMVLVEPNIPYESAFLAQAAPAMARFEGQMLPYAKACWNAAKAGRIRAGTPAAQCLYTPPGPPLPKPLLEAVQRPWEKPGLWQDVVLATEADARSSAEVQREQRPYGEMPLIVLTSDTRVNAAQLPIPPAQKLALASAWQRSHDAIAALSTRGRNVLVAGSPSSIEVSRPSSVIAAIDNVLAEVRR